MKITFCKRCPLGQSTLPSALSKALLEKKITAKVSDIDCLSGCARPSAISVRQTGKTAYLFGDLNENDLNDLVYFVDLYAQSSDGNFADARPLGTLREKAIARIPA
ncbi:MAG: DUF1636 family protein [Paracoccaceae bacterium]